MGEAISENIAHNIRRLREERALSQQQVAQLAGVPRPTWANLESGGANPTVLVLTKVAVALNTQIQELLAPPMSEARLYEAESLPSRRRGKATIRSLLTEATPGLELERMTLPPNSHLVGAKHAQGTWEYLTCELGELTLTASGNSYALRAGDVLVFRGDQRHTYKNHGPLRAVAYAIVSLAGTD